MPRFTLRARIASLAAASACALAGGGAASAAGPVFAVVPDQAAAPASFTPTINFDSVSALTGSDATAAAALARESLGALAVSIALRHIGVPYVWGGETPSGFDCSGLTMYVYGLLGISLPHYTGYQIEAGSPVALSQVQPGDLLFFNRGANGDPGHEGMYIGRGLMVHAPQLGDHVRVSVLDSSRMASFMGAVRPY